MISQDELWKEELLKISKKILKRIMQKRWTNRSIFTFEKEMFFGFFAVRKLIESKKVEDEILNQNLILPAFPHKILPEEQIGKILPYELAPKEKKQFTIQQICNQFIHSKYVIPFGANNTLIAIFITSDHHQKRALYLVTLFQIVEIFRLIAGKEGLID